MENLRTRLLELKEKGVDNLYPKEWYEMVFLQAVHMNSKAPIGDDMPEYDDLEDHLNMQKGLFAVQTRLQQRISDIYDWTWNEQQGERNELGEKYITATQKKSILELLLNNPEVDKEYIEEYREEYTQNMSLQYTTIDMAKWFRSMAWDLPAFSEEVQRWLKGRAIDRYTCYEIIAMGMMIGDWDT